MFWSLVLIVLVALVFILKKIVARMAKGEAPERPTIASFAQMRDKGLITEEEYQAIKRKLAKRELERMSAEDQAKAQAAAASDPIEALRQRAAHEAEAKGSTPGQSGVANEHSQPHRS